MKCANFFLIIILVFSCKEKESRKTYYPNGKLKSKTAYVTEKIDSLRKGYFKNGNTKYIKHFKDSQVVYKEKYAKDGELVSKSREIDVLLENDTIKLGEKLNFKFIPYGKKIESSKKIIALVLKLNMFEKIKDNNHSYFRLTTYGYDITGESEDNIGYTKVDSGKLVKKITSPDHPIVKFSYTPKESGSYYLFSTYSIRDKGEESGINYSLPIEFYVKK